MEASSMNAERFNWKERAQLVGGIAIVALIQVGLLFPDTHDLIGSWLAMMLFGTIYAVVGGATTSRFEKRRRSTSD
jgi:peptidoglycan/LPS O-acetylase OafA/YrhL